jgi:hypothetical protein
VDEAERALAALRDGCIDLLRQEPSARERRSLRHALNQVNATLSLILGVEYPVLGVQENLLKDARKTLKSLLHRAALRPD